MDYNTLDRQNKNNSNMLHRLMLFLAHNDTILKLSTTKCRVFLTLVVPKKQKTRKFEVRPK